MNSVILRKYVTKGASAATSDGRRMVFDAARGQICAAVQLNVQLAIEPGRGELHSDLIRATSRFADDAGRVWETCDRISVAELYHEAIRRPVYAFASPLNEVADGRLGLTDARVEINTLIRDAFIYVDDSNFRTVCVFREKASWKDEWDRYEHLVFLMQEKVLCARVNIVERVYRRTKPSPFENRSIHLLIWSEFSPSTSTAITRGGSPLKIDPVDYCQLAPLSAEIRLADFLWSTVWRREREDDCEYWLRESPTVAKCVPTTERGEPTRGVTVQ